MKKLNSTILLILVCLLGGCEQQTPTTMSNGQPMPPLQTGQALGFANPTWFGTEPAKDLDPVLTRHNYLIVLDGSGSMADQKCSGDLRKIDAAKAAIKAFAAKLGPEDNLGLCAFDSQGVSERTPLGTNNRKEFNQALSNVLSDSSTPLSDAVQLGYDVIKKQARRQLGYGQYFLVIVTDGEANPGYDPTAIVNTIVAESPVIISTVGFCIGEGHSLNRPGLTLYHDATNLKQLNEGLESVLAESEFQPNTSKK